MLWIFIEKFLELLQISSGILFQLNSVTHKDYLTNNQTTKKSEPEQPGPKLYPNNSKYEKDEKT